MNIQYRFFLIWTVITATAGFAPPEAYANPVSRKPFLVVLDPGHGGADHGAQVPVGGGRYVTEKEVTLILAKEVATELIRRGVRVALTRTQDMDVPLAERTAMANRLKADAFISIHMNSSQNTEGEAEGVETYFLNNSTDTSSKRLADLENSVLEGSRAQGIAPAAAPGAGQGDVALIVKDLMLDNNLAESEQLACAVQNHVVRATSTASTRYRNRGVKQALFYVLLGADMPSVLVEAGFLNNSRDRLIVSSNVGQHRIASAITNAIQEFRAAIASRNPLITLGRCKSGEHPVFARKTVQQARLSRFPN